MPATRTATRTLTTTEAAVLSLLAIEGENSGYDLLKYVQKAIGYVWAPARSQLYSLLPRLVKDGYARSRSVSQSERPDKTLYKITREGRRALDGWLEHVDPNDRAAFQLRLFVGALTDDDVLVRHVEAFRATRPSGSPSTGRSSRPTAGAGRTSTTTSCCAGASSRPSSTSSGRTGSCER